MRKVWGDIADDVKTVIANDVLHLTESYKWFMAHCEAETNFLFKDEFFSYNNPEFFKYSRYIN